VTLEVEGTLVITDAHGVKHDWRIGPGRVLSISETIEADGIQEITVRIATQQPPVRRIPRVEHGL
jgi:hypothetical protein